MTQRRLSLPDPIPRHRALVESLHRLVLLAPLLLAACTTDAPAAVAEPALRPAAAAALPSGFRLYSEPVMGVRFPMPATDLAAEVKHFDPTLPAQKFRHALHLVTPEGAIQILLHGWDNPQRLDLRTWFDEYMAFIVDETSLVTERPMGSAHVPGILVMQPRSPQAASQATAVFLAGDHIYRLTCIDPENDLAARALFERILDQIETETETKTEVRP
jgi:hypothetical protein